MSILKHPSRHASSHLRRRWWIFWGTLISWDKGQPQPISTSCLPFLLPKELVYLVCGIFDLLTGGILGAFCSYAYPASESIAHVLKDGDYLLYLAFKSCGLDTCALAISSTGDWYATIFERAQSKNIPIQHNEKNKAAKVWSSLKTSNPIYLVYLSA